MNVLKLSRIKLAILAALAVLMFCSDVRGTTFITMSDEDLTHSSAAIALGEVQAIATDNDSVGDIHTAVTIAVEEQIKGAPQAVLTMVMPGGTAGDIRRVVYG